MLHPVAADNAFPKSHANAASFTNTPPLLLSLSLSLSFCWHVHQQQNLRYEQIKKAVNLSLTDKPLQKGAADKAQLVALSNTYGYFVAGMSDGMVKVLRDFVEASPRAWRAADAKLCD